MEEAILLVVTNTKDEDGFPIQSTEEFPIYVLNEKSVARAEFYEAYRSGISVKTVLEIRDEDWRQTEHLVDGKKEYATKILYDGSAYDIIRSYRPDKAVVELTCA